MRRKTPPASIILHRHIALQPCNAKRVAYVLYDGFAIPQLMLCALCVLQGIRNPYFGKETSRRLGGAQNRLIASWSLVPISNNEIMPAI